MQRTYKITYLIGQLDANANPPAIVAVIFPGIQTIKCEVSEEQYLITVPEGTPEPLNLSPLIKIELLS